MNQIFGYQTLPEDVFSNDVMFDGTEPIRIPMDSKLLRWQVRLFAHPSTNLKFSVSYKNGRCCYVWGIPSHPEIATSDISDWCSYIVAENSYERFKELLGTFVVIIDEPNQDRITFVTDILGMRPMFLGNFNDRLVFGSDVWAIQKAGLVKGMIDYDAISSWIAYGYNCTGGSLFSDLRRLPPGSAVIYQNGKSMEFPYAEFKAKPRSSSPRQISEDVHDIVSSSVKTLLADHHRLTMTLSGGYDSRYLLALSLALAELSTKSIFTVAYTENEGQISSRVAETLGVPLRMLDVSGSIWDLYDQLYHFTSDGFPISKFVTYCIAEQYPGIPMVNGFMGDSLIQGSKDTFQGKYETEWIGDIAEILQRKHLLIGFKLMGKLFRGDIANRVLMRSRLPMEEAVRNGSSIGKIFAWADFYYRQRFYISNNFLQHTGLTEALLPFYTWELLSYKMEHDYKVFSRDIYREIFQNHFPALADIPHASELPPQRSKSSLDRVARCTKRWARQLLPVLCQKNRLSHLSKTRCVPLTFAGIMGSRRAQNSILTFIRMYLLEQRLIDTGVAFDWELI
jgi:hypothetical protein